MSPSTFLRFYGCTIALFFFFFPLHISGKVERLVPQVIAKIPHSKLAFTQGLAVVGDKLYESTGLYGESSVRMIDLATGEVVRHQQLSPAVFGEGIAVFSDQILLLTWRENQVIVLERDSLKERPSLFYSGEGWGLCRDGNTVWMSNGSSVLTQRGIASFDPIKMLKVRYDGKPLTHLNDLECVGDFLYANVWLREWLVRIDKNTGEVTGWIDASSLLSPAEKKRLRPDEVLNGIAYRPEKGTFLITGKRWPWIFEVKFIPK